MTQSIKSCKSGAISGRASVPGDKSISHRALIFGAISTGQTQIRGLLQSEDVIATREALKSLGVHIVRDDNVHIVTGSGLGGLMVPEGPLDFGNSGTGARLMMGVVAGNPICAEFSGDKSLSNRPMDRVLDPLRSMGVTVSPQSANSLPLSLTGPDRLIPIEYELPVASAQVKSALLIAGLHAPGKTVIVEPIATRDHTERLINYFGADIDISEDENGRTIQVAGDTNLTGRQITVPGDPSSAAFLATAALICPDSNLTIESVLTNPARIGFYLTLEEMGADIQFKNQREVNGEPVSDIQIKYSKLNGILVPAERAPSMIDEYPCLSVIAAFSNGSTIMEGLSELRVKESDRLSAMADGLKKCGVDVTEEQDRLIVNGGGVAGGSRINPRLDHRIAMAFLTLGLGADHPVIVDEVETIRSSFPDYMGLMKSIGANFRDIKNGKDS